MFLSNHRRSFIAFGTTGLVLAALAVWLLIAATASAATPRYVNATTGIDTGDCSNIGSPCLTISYAVTQSVAGDTINVAAGTYNETVTIPVGLTGLNLKGAQAGVAVAGRTAAGPAESTVNGGLAGLVIKVNAPNVTIDGFSLTDPSVTGGASIAIDVKTTGTSVVIQNNIIDNVKTTNASGTAQGIWLDGGPDGVQILGNQISNLQSPKSAQGILIGDSAAANSSDNVLIQGNTIKLITSINKGAYGVAVNNRFGASNLQIKSNTFDTLTGGGWLHAIGLEANTPGVLVKSNSFSGLSSPGADKTAVWFESEDTSFPSGNVNQNNFLTTSAGGIAVDPALPVGSVDGTCNWWGDASGPGPVASGTGALVSPKVTYSPWLIGPAPAAPCTGPLPTPNPNAVGGFVDVVTGGTGSGGAMGLSWPLAGLVAITAVGGSGIWLALRRRS
jgi:hypothetical protein